MEPLSEVEMAEHAAFAREVGADPLFSFTIQRYLIVRVRNPTSRVVYDAAKVASDALFDSKNGVISVKGCGGDPDIFFKLHLVLAQCAAANAYLFVAVDTRIWRAVGCLSAYHPGATQSDITASGVSSLSTNLFSDFVASLPADLQPFWTFLAPAVVNIVDYIVGDGGKKPAWAINSFAVLSEHRQKGLGTRLLHQLEKAVKHVATASSEATKKPIFMETQSALNYTIATKMGFVAHKPAPAIPFVTSSSFWILRKDVSD
ncbi:GNAT family N-acetyltransferase [Phanerochaete sordida]|uniref:GNAT family N-acetyltransferase n=1 Tax=Phanerochaete sordida TaxID=48140 RepID=A0A9P3GLF9_9APHY|nr:GNAT family N-acetyltransferase [Phanerochaete sordida]